MPHGPSGISAPPLLPFSRTVAVPWDMLHIPVKEASDRQSSHGSGPRGLLLPLCPEVKKETRQGGNKKFLENYFSSRIFLGLNPEEGILDSLWTKVE